MNEISNVADRQDAQSAWSDLYLKEDYWAVWLGFALIVAGLFIFLPNPPGRHRQHNR